MYGPSVSCGECFWYERLSNDNELHYPADGTPPYGGIGTCVAPVSWSNPRGLNERYRHLAISMGLLRAEHSACDNYEAKNDE